MALTLSSPAFGGGERIPKKYTCDGQDISPPLNWRTDRTDVKSYAMVCADPDAPDGTFYHWAVYDMPPETTELREGGSVAAVREAQNDFGNPGYGGPCPPEGHGDHRYQFLLIALPVPNLGVPQDANAKDVLKAARTKALEETKLEGLYAR